MYVDAALGKEKDAKSQGAFMILDVEAAKGCDPFAIHTSDSLSAHILHYSSRIIRGAAHNTLCAEAYAMVHAADYHLAIGEQCRKIGTDVTVCLHVVSDCMSLYSTVLSANPRPEELKLLPTITKIKEQLGECGQRLYHAPGHSIVRPGTRNT